MHLALKKLGQKTGSSVPGLRQPPLALHEELPICFLPFLEVASRPLHNVASLPSSLLLSAWVSSFLHKVKHIQGSWSKDVHKCNHLEPCDIDRVSERWTNFLLDYIVGPEGL